MRTPSGKLNRRVMIQRHTTEYDAFNAPVREWVNHAQRWASFSYTGGGEGRYGDQTAAERAATVTLRYGDDLIRPQDRILYDGRVFDVVRVIDEDEARENIVCECLERVQS